MTPDAVLPHNTKAAATWNSGGQHYDRISHSIADSIEHCVHRLAPRRGERVLDVATGTGWTARRVAARDATVIGVDLGPDLIAAAQALAAEHRLAIDFRVGDAEKLPFDDQSFDAVISTCGVMFASNPEAVAAELARVCRKGGRIGLTTWPPDGTIAGLFKVMRPFMPPPPPSPPPSPFEWGRPERVTALLGRPSICASRRVPRCCASRAPRPSGSSSSRAMGRPSRWRRASMRSGARASSAISSPTTRASRATSVWRCPATTS